MDSNDGTIQSGVIDAANSYGYFGTDSTYPGVIIKVALGTGSSPPERVSAVTLATSDKSQFYSAAIDATSGYAYFTTFYTNPTTVIKMALGSGTLAPEEVGAVTLNIGESYPWNDLIVDDANGFAYIGTQASYNNYVIKVALGSGSSPPVRVAALAMKSDESILKGSAIDQSSGYCYFVAFTRSGRGRLIQIGLDSSNVSAPVRTADTYLSSSGAAYLAVDRTNGYAYALDSKRLVKVSLKPVCTTEAPSATPTSSKCSTYRLPLCCSAGCLIIAIESHCISG